MPEKGVNSGPIGFRTRALPKILIQSHINREQMRIYAEYYVFFMIIPFFPSVTDLNSNATQVAMLSQSQTNLGGKNLMMQFYFVIGIV